MIDQLAALATLRFDWADTPDHVWRDSPYHVDGLHADVLASIEGGIRDAAGSDGPSPIGLVLQGQKGVGKTHLLGMVRRQAHLAGGYFFLCDVTSGDAFWENTAEALRRGLSRPNESGEPQIRTFLRHVCERAELTPSVTATILSGHGLTRKDVDAFVDGLRRLDRQVGVECADTARALVLYASEESALTGIGENHLEGFEELKHSERSRWGLRSRSKPALAQVQDMTRLLALTGPLVMAVDQLDTLVAQSAQHTQRVGDGGEEDKLVAQIADGLMRLREVTRRTVTLLTCLPGTWAQIRAKATDSVPDRFRESRTLGRVPDADLGRALVAKRLGVVYEAIGFEPPYPTWPVAPAAFEGQWDQYTPRELLKRISAHIELCLKLGEVRELAGFDERDQAPPAPVVRSAPQPPGRFAKLDARFEELKAGADISALLAQKAENKVMPVLLSAALRGWITEVGDDNMEWTCVPQNTGNTDLHAWLTHTVDETSDLEERWAFRVITGRHAYSALTRLRKARSAAGTGRGTDNRHLVLVRDHPWSKGEKTQAALKDLTAAGGVNVKLSKEDVRTFWALDRMLDKGGNEVHEWLVDRRPASRSDLLSSVLPKSAGARDNGTHPPPDPRIPSAPTETEFPLGQVRLELESLRQHTAVFAGSGSGKTVLLRRIIEECALRGVSSIVLDPNNDLARLGDAWPTPPQAWGRGDAGLAERYLSDTDVVVWTPGRANGRPLAFQPLPDFAGVLDDDDEFTAAVEVAVASLAPQLRLTGTTGKVNIGLAVLRQAVVHYARKGSRSLEGLIDTLADLPPGVSTLNDGRRIAGDLAEMLKAAMVNDPLLAGGAQPVDPSALLIPAQGKRARVSVISFVGLPGEEQRQNFVNQLQMELFAWIKRNPAGDRPLGALFVMDEAQTMAASGTLTASARSTIVLASQARKYGLGLLFATQAPKGLHNQVAGNAMTQFFGRLNSPAQIAAANEMARAKGSPVADISRLERGQFYVSGESFGFRQVETPLCLTHHPASPLRIEEVIERARG
jgi:protein tyrosine phosphatase (PTP) superfamily phosphohydrolase (DUF442 family)